MIARTLPPGRPDYALDLGARRRARVLLLSDTHGYLDQRVGNLARACDLVVHAGDVGASAVLDVLADACARAVAVAGNNDSPTKWNGSKARLSALPGIAWVRLPGGLLVVVHGDRHNPASQRHERLRATYPDARCIVYGHTHRLICDTAHTPWVVNPGAAGRNRTFGGPSCLILDTRRAGWRLETHRYERVKRAATPTAATARR